MLSYYIFNNKIVVLSAYELHFTFRKSKELNITTCFPRIYTLTYEINFHK